MRQGRVDTPWVGLPGVTTGWLALRTPFLHICTSGLLVDLGPCMTTDQRACLLVQGEGKKPRSKVMVCGWSLTSSLAAWLAIAQALVVCKVLGRFAGIIRRHSHKQYRQDCRGPLHLQGVSLLGSLDLYVLKAGK